MPRVVAGGSTGASRLGAVVDRRGTTEEAPAEGVGRRAAGEGSAAEGAGVGDGGGEDEAAETFERRSAEEGGADEDGVEGDPPARAREEGRARASDE